MIRFTPDDRFLTMSDPFAQTVRVIDVKTGKEVARWNCSLPTRKTRTSISSISPLPPMVPPLSP